MSLAIRQIHPVFVGEVSGVDIAKPLSADEVAAIEAGMDRYAVLVFHDQKITDEQQMAFSRNFGALEDARGGNITKPEDKRLQTGMNDVSNLGRDGQPLARDSRQRLFNLGNMLWHSDSSFRPIPAKYSLLSARVVNPIGREHRVRRHARGLRRARRGDEGADRGPGLRALADVLARLARHARLLGRGAGDVPAGAPAAGAHAPGDRPQVALPLVPRRRHRRHADAEARILLRDLTEHATQPRFVYAHRGVVGTWSCGTTGR